MALALGVVLGVVAVVFTPRPLLHLVDKLDPLTAGALVIAAVGLLVAFGRRRGAGWAVARGALVGAGLGVAIVLVFFGVCIATQCLG